MSQLTDWIAEYNPEALLADGFNDAILGICERIGMEPVVAYDRDRCIEILMQEFEASYPKGTLEDDDEGEDLYSAAVDYFEYNVIGSYVGEGTPVFITCILPDDYRPVPSFVQQMEVDWRKE